MGDTSDFAYWPQCAVKLRVYDEDRLASVQIWIFSTPCLSGLKAGQVEMDEMLPELVSQQLALAPKPTAQDLRVRIRHLWKRGIWSTNEQ